MDLFYIKTNITNNVELSHTGVVLVIGLKQIDMRRECLVRVLHC